MTEKEKSNNDVIQTLRTAHQNQTQLNLMADQKANILIGTLVLMFTVVLTRLITLAENNHMVLITLTVFVLMQIIPLILTVMVLIPKNINQAKVKDIGSIRNPLFFGFFTQYTQQEYSKYMSAVLIDNEAARHMLVNDIYQIGVILRRKYMLLRMAYLFALLGVLVPVIMGLYTAFK
ncbi:MAG: Pycsar system effector family protein [Marinicella sp.]